MPGPHLQDKDKIARLEIELAEAASERRIGDLQTRQLYAERSRKLQGAIEAYVTGARKSKAQAIYQLVALAQQETAQVLNEHYAAKLRDMATVVARELGDQLGPLPPRATDNEWLSVHGTPLQPASGLDSSLLMTPSPTPSPAATPSVSPYGTNQ